MTYLVRCFIALTVSIVLLGSDAYASSLTAAQMAKLHPTLQRLVVAHAKFFNESPWRETELSGAAEIGVLVYTRDPNELRATGIKVQSVLPGFVTARVTTTDIETVARLNGVTWVDPGTVNGMQNDVSVPETGACLLHAGFLNATRYRGNGVIVLIYDTGIDWKHLDFRDPVDQTKSRILAIWDQTLTPQGGESSPSGFTYGVEYDKSAIEKEISGITTGAVREKDLHGHGTHVAGIAAGNALGMGKYGGMAPEADIVVVKGSNGSFSESYMIDGLAYANTVGQRFGKPVVVNWSIGGQNGPHDGTSGYEVAIDNFTATPGRVVCTSAGNDGDLYLHRGGTLAGNGSDTIRVYVPAYTPWAGPNNDRMFLDGHLRSSDMIDMEVISPNGVHLHGVGTSLDSTDGFIDAYNYILPGNGDRGFQVMVSDKGGISVPAPGTWTLVVTNPSGNPLDWDAWLQPGYRVGGQPSYLVDGDNEESVSMPGTAKGAITVGSYVTRWSWPSLAGQRMYYGDDRTGDISLFSSMGPTADGRVKPDITAPGQGVISCFSSSVDTTGLNTSIVLGRMHRLLDGTSMAAPHVAGACALLLQQNSSLTAAQIKTYLQNGADIDAMTGGVPNTVWGGGKLNILKTMAALIGWPTPVTRTLLSYDGAGTNMVRPLAGDGKFAVRLTPTSTGQVTGLLVNVTTAVNNAIVGTGNLDCEFFTNAGGLPGSKIGNTVTVPLSYLCTGTVNYVQTLAAGVNVAPGTDYFAVLSVPGSGDTLKIRSDNLTDGTHSAAYNGTWEAVNYNFRIRAIVTGSTSTSIGGEGTVQPLEFDLAQNWPNPFNPTTTIAYSIGQEKDYPEGTPIRGGTMGLGEGERSVSVQLVVYDILGREVRTLVNESQRPGSYQVRFDGRGLASGVYFYRLQAGSFVQTRKLLLLR